MNLRIKVHQEGIVCQDLSLRREEDHQEAKWRRIDGDEIMDLNPQWKFCRGGEELLKGHQEVDYVSVRMQYKELQELKMILNILLLETWSRLSK